MSDNLQPCGADDTTFAQPLYTPIKRRSFFRYAGATAGVTALVLAGCSKDSDPVMTNNAIITVSGLSEATAGKAGSAHAEPAFLFIKPLPAIFCADAYNGFTLPGHLPVGFCSKFNFGAATQSFWNCRGCAASF